MVKSYKSSLFLITVSFSIIFSSCTAHNPQSENICFRIDMVNGMTKQEKKMSSAIRYAWMRDAKVCDLGEYKVAFPADNKDGTIYIWKNDYKILEINGGSEVNIFEKVPGDLNDFNLDGTPETKLYFYKTEQHEAETEIWIENAWHVQKRKNNKIGVMINDEWKEVYFNNGIWEYTK